MSFSQEYYYILYKDSRVGPISMLKLDDVG